MNYDEKTNSESWNRDKTDNTNNDITKKDIYDIVPASIPNLKTTIVMFFLWLHHSSKGPVTQASITRMKMRTLKLHPLDWLGKRGCILRGATQPIKCVLFVSLSLSFLLSLQCDSALTQSSSYRVVVVPTTIGKVSIDWDITLQNTKKTKD